MRVEAFDFTLPQDRIATEPLAQRGAFDLIARLCGEGYEALVETGVGAPPTLRLRPAIRPLRLVARSVPASAS